MGIMNALKAHRKDELERNNRLGPSSFLKHVKGWTGPATLYVSRVFPHEVYATKADPFQLDIMAYDYILTDKKKRQYKENEFYLGWFKLLK